jgi:hypothetical protein
VFAITRLLVASLIVLRCIVCDPRAMTRADLSPDARVEELERPDLVGYSLASVSAAIWVGAVGVVLPGVVILLAWMLTPHDQGSGDLGSTLQFTAILWAIAHVVPVLTPTGVVSLFPLLLILLPVLLMRRAARKAALSVEPETLSRALLLTSLIAGMHTLLVLAVGLAGSTESMLLKPLDLALRSFLIAVAITLPTVLSAAGLVDDVRDRIPALVRAAVAGGVVAFLMIVSAGSVLLVIAVIHRRSDIAAVSDQVGQSNVASVFLLVLSLLYVPTLIGWVTTWMTGAGVHVGGGAVLGLASGSPDELPPVPLLAVLPEVVPEWTRFLPLVVVFAAAAGAALVHRRMVLLSMAQRFMAVVVLAVVAAGLLGATGLLTGGSLGSVRLVDLGPHAKVATLYGLWQVGLGAALVLLLPLLASRVVAMVRTKDDRSASRALTNEAASGV